MRPILKMPDAEIPARSDLTLLRRLLIDAVGAYCAYCESPLTVDVLASHKVSYKRVVATIDGVDTEMRVKAERFTTAWANLLPGCAACVAAKGEVPDISNGLSLLKEEDDATYRGLLDAGPRGLDEVQADLLFGYSLRNWVWPDEAANEDGALIVLEGDPTWNLFTYERSERSMTDLVTGDLVRLSGGQAEAPWAVQASTQVWVVPNETWINAQADRESLEEKARATLLGLNLNLHNPSDPRAADRRVEHRTAGADAADDCLVALEEVVERVRNRPDADLDLDDDLDHDHVESFLSVARESLRATGFWSVWLWWFVHNILEKPSPMWSAYSVEARKDLLYRLFVQYEIDLRRLRPSDGIRLSQGAPIPADAPSDVIVTQMVLPGTDLRRMPLWS